MEESPLQEKVFAIEQLVAGIIHEIGNPLVIMKSTMSFLHEQALRMGGDMATYTQVVMENLDRVNELLKDLSEFSRPKKDPFEPHDISKPILETAQFVEKECERNGILMETSIEVPLPAVYIAPNRLKQAFLNVIKNGIESMPRGGRLSIRARCSGSSLWGRDAVSIEFIDTGRGMSEEEMRAAFRPFYTTKKYGSGLGLFITRNIIREHNGRMDIRSKRGEGTTVSISLPIGGPEDENA